MNHLDHDHKTIEHIPNEKRLPKWIWKAGWALVALLWVLFLIDGINWPQIMLGVGTGCFLVSWVADTAGLDVPASWRSKPPRQ